MKYKLFQLQKWDILKLYKQQLLEVKTKQQQKKQGISQLVKHMIIH